MSKGNTAGMKLSLLRHIIGVLFAFLFAIIAAHPAQAADFNVGCTAGVGDTAGLITAINTANGNGEADTINLTAGCTYSFTAGDATNNDSALPRITTPIMINGNGATIERDSGSPAFRLLRIESGGNLTLNGVTVTGGDSSGVGGGIRNLGTLTVTNSTIADNSTISDGGGIANGGTLTVTNSTITGNTTSASNGGGIHNNGGTVTVTNSTISGNSATGFSGGGIFNGTGGTLSVTNSTITGNSAGAAGGIYNGGTMTLTDSTIAGNSATNADGGGIGNVGTMTLTTNTIISGNSAFYGGGIANIGTVTVTNSTIAGNSATTIGGGIRNSSGTVTVTNSIVWGNSSPISIVAGTVNVSYSIVQGGGFDGDGNLDADPLFVSPVSHTLAPTTGGDYRLLADSPALNVGSNAALPPEITTDLDGNPRVVNVVVDMGAYEHQVAAAVIVSETSVSVAEGGATDSYTVRLASKPPFNVTVNISTGGQTTINPVTLTFTPDNWSTGQTVTVTAVDDGTAEGPHADTITHTASSTDLAYNGIAVASVSVAVIDDDAGDLLYNGDFEVDTDLDKVPDGWTLKNGFKDKLKCNTLDKTVSFTGDCAFKLKGGLDEKAKLIQNVDFSGVTLNQGDTLRLSAYFKRNNIAVSAKFILSMRYAGSADPVKMKETVTVGPSPDYLLVSVPELTLDAGVVDQIKVVLKHKSTASKLWIDTASLIHASGTGRRSEVPPPPAAPDGFRGGN